jgi:hypothetical protein
MVRPTKVKQRIHRLMIMITMKNIDGYNTLVQNGELKYTTHSSMVDNEPDA